MAYTKYQSNWQDGSSGGTPITEAALDHIETGIFDAAADADTAQAAVDAHIADTSDAHDASAISVVDAGGYFAGTDVEAVLQALGAIGAVPAGVVLPYGGSAAPSGYLMCDGATATTASQPTLFAAIGYTFGGAGASFTLPDIQGRMLVGKGTHANVDTLGENDGSSLANRQPKHRHTVTDPGHTHDTGINPTGNQAAGGSHARVVNAGANGAVTQSATTGITIDTAGASAPLDGPAYIVLNFIIKT